MSIDLQDIAYQITNNTPRDAAIITARLLHAVMKALPTPQGHGQFVSILRAEMAKAGYRFEYDSRLVRFSKLQVGEQFKRLDGKQYSKIEPVKEIVGPHRMEIVLEAFDQQLNQRVYIEPDETVEKIEPEK